MSRCARIASVTPIGHVLATSTVWQIARETCSTGRLCDDSNTDVTASDDGLIWCAEHGWHTFKGIKQPLEIVQIKDKVLSQRSFPETLPRLQRLSSHTADALRQNELKYAMVRSLSSGRDGDMHYVAGGINTDESMVKSMEDENDSLKGRVTNLEEKNTKLHDENTKLYDENTKLHDDNTKLYDENTKLQDENASLREEKSILQEKLGCLHESGK